MSQQVFDDLMATLPDGIVRQVCIGALWTAVVAEISGERRCGLASTLRDESHGHHSGPAVLDAGHLHRRSARDLAALTRSPRPMEVAVGTAALNALLPRRPELWVDVNAEELIAAQGAGKSVALVGHFPFVARLRERVGQLWVLEQRPVEGDLPAEAADEVVPQAAVLAMTGMTLMNRTFEKLMALRRADTAVMLLGASTPLSPRLFDYGVHLLAGAVVEDVDSVLQAVCQGANFRQVRREGVRLVAMRAPT